MLALTCLDKLIIWSFCRHVNNKIKRLLWLAAIRLLDQRTERMSRSQPCSCKNRYFAAAAVTVNDEALNAIPPDVISEILPVVAPTGTTALSDVEDTGVTDFETVPLNFTHVTPVRLAPVMVTVVPIGPEVGANEVIAGEDAVTVNCAELVAIPPDVINEIFPVVVPTVTMAFSIVAETGVIDFATVPLNFTHETPVKFVPVIVTDVPTGPEAGVKEAIEGARAGASILMSDAADVIPSVDMIL